MAEIEWKGFDGTAFQVLCNVILYHIVSKKASLYSAPGTDGGIDQYFVGTWQDQTGKWRFQDKFKSTEKGLALAQLRKDIRDDINNHFKGEDYIVFLTTVNLRPDEDRELKDIAAATFAGRGDKKPATVLIWHHATLETMILSNPIIYNHFFARGKALLENYRVHFYRQLHAPDLRDTFANPFFGRIDKIEELRHFLSGPDAMAVLTGPGNYGKTRTVIQFFETVIDLNEDWLALVLKPNGFSASTFAQLLLGERKMVVLLDDAHRHLDLLADIKNEAEKYPGRIKIILTARTDFFAAILGSLPSHSKTVREVRFVPLSPVETKEIIRSLLPFHPEENLQWLRGHSLGVPGVVVALCYLVQRGVHPSGIATDNVFDEFVIKMVGEAIDMTERATKLDKRTIQKVIRLLALLAPLAPRDEDYSLLADLSNCAVEEIDEIIAALQKCGLVRTDPELAIKPDPVSDTFLRQTFEQGKRWVQNFIDNPLLVKYFGNMVNNLLEAQIANVGGKALIEDLIRKYIEQIKEATVTEAAVRRVLQTAIRLAQRNPHIGLQTLEVFLQAYVNKSHPLHQATVLTESPFGRLKEDAMTLLGRLFRSSGNEGSFPVYWAMFLRMNEEFNEMQLVYRCFGFGPYDFENSPLRTGPCCHRQRFLVDKTKTFFTSSDSREVEIALTTVNCLYVDDYHTGDVIDPYTNEMHFINGRVPNCAHTGTIRKDLMAGLIAYYRKHRGNQDLDPQWFARIGRVLHFQFSFAQRKYEIDEAEAFALAMEYTSELLANDATPIERAVIASANKLGKHRELKPAYAAQHQRLDELLDAGSPKSRMELFLSTRRYDSRDIQDKLKQIFSLYPGPAEMIEDLKSLLCSCDNLLPEVLMTVARFLGIDHSTYALELYSYVIERAPVYIRALSGITDYFWNDDTVFYGLIDRLWALEDIWEAKPLVVAILASKQRIDHGRIQTRDLNYFEWAIADGSNFSCYQLTHNLYRFSSVDTPRTFDMLKQLAEKVKHNSIDEIVYGIAADIPFCDRFSTQVIDFFKLIASFVDPISNPFLPALTFIHKSLGDAGLFEFLANEAMRRNGEGYYTFCRAWYYGDLTFMARCDLFKTFLTWLPSCPQLLDRRLREELLQYFRPGLSKEPGDIVYFSHFFEGVIEMCTCQNELEDLAVALQGYGVYDATTLGIQCRLINKMMAIRPGFCDTDKLLGGSYINNTNIGKRSVPGHPSIENKEKEQFLTNYLAEHILPNYIQKLLTEALRIVREEMERETLPLTW
ncbi:MAG TPA: hypothetical protein VHE34_13120 [Puia sp.]|uniref:hypothetical protein n=1 Tax=Puia sp. TaxID=2045100 RepID=UPI002C42CB3C|nr:hypothetical protein [Puia sp.]HVU96163.1 hypothetical protein [Puia sp.]